jgi:PAS domain S-box-containing protein
MQRNVGTYGRIRVLCVDDEVSMLELMKKFIELSPDMSVEYTDSSLAALEMLDKGQFDAVVVDYSMPEMNGIDMLKKLRGKGDQIPFILLTGKGREEVAVEALNTGADFYLQKTTDVKPLFAELANMIRQSVQQRRAEETLYKTSQRLQAVIDSSPIPILTVDMGGSVVTWNHAAENVFGWKQEEVIGKPVPFVPPEAQHDFRLIVDKVRGGGSFSGVDLKRVKKDGSLIYISLSTAPIRDQKGDIIGIMAAIVDVTQKKQMEENLRRMNRLYAFLSEANAAIVRTKSRQELFDEVCRVAVEHGSFRMAWIGLVNKMDNTYEPAASSGVGSEFVNSLRIPLDDIDLNAGPTGRAVKEGKLMVSRDIATDQTVGSWRERALSFGYRSSASIPIRLGGTVIGTLNLYSEEPEFFTDKETDLMMEISATVSYALDMMKNQESRKRAQASFKRESELTQRVLETAGSIITVLDRQGNIVRFNKEAERVTGYGSDEVLGKPIYDIFIPPEIRGDITKVFESLKAGSFPSRYENEWLTKDGSRRMILWNNTALVDKDGAVTFVIATGIDVTEKRKMEKSLKEREAHLRMITDNMLDMIAQIDMTGNYVYASSSHRSATGFEPETMIGKPFSEYIHPDDVAGLLDAFANAIESDNLMGSAEFRIKKADGSYIWVESSGKGIKDASGKVVGGVFGTRNISSRKKAEEALIKRTEEAEAAKNRAQTYLDFMSHDIMNIITPLMSYSEIISNNERNPEDTQKYASKMFLQLKRLSSFVTNVRRLSHSETELLRGYNEVDLKAVLSKYEEEIRVRYSDKEITVKYSLPEGPILVPGKGYIEDVVSQLLDNALKHTKRKDVVVEVSVVPSKWKGERLGWHVEIADNGPGIPDDQKKLLLAESFGATSARLRGVATTFAFMSLLVEHLGGSVSVEDRVKGDHSQGARIILRLPMAKP